MSTCHDEGHRLASIGSYSLVNGRNQRIDVRDGGRDHLHQDGIHGLFSNERSDTFSEALRCGGRSEVDGVAQPCNISTGGDESFTRLFGERRDLESFVVCLICGDDTEPTSVPDDGKPRSRG